jgi:hypothetical protein
MSVTLPTLKIKSLLNYKLFLLYDFFFYRLLVIFPPRHPYPFEDARRRGEKVTFLFNGASRSAAP